MLALTWPRQRRLAIDYDPTVTAAVEPIAAVAGVAAVHGPIHWHPLYLSNVFFAMQVHWYGEVAHFWSLAVKE